MPEAAVAGPAARPASDAGRRDLLADPVPAGTGQEIGGGVLSTAILPEPDVARQRPRSLIALQRAAGNGAVASLVKPRRRARTVQRQEPPSPSGADEAEALREKYPPMPGDKLSEISMLNAFSGVYAKIVERDRLVASAGTAPVPGGMPPELSPRVKELDEEIKAGLGGMPEQEFIDKVNELEAKWKDRASEIAIDHLEQSRRTVEDEMVRYGEQEEAGQAGEEGDLQLADQHLSEISDEIKPLLEKEAELKKAEEALEEDVRRRAGAEGGSAVSPYEAVEKLRLEHAELMADLQPVRDEFLKVAAAYGARFPVLFSPSYKPGAYQMLTPEETAASATATLEETLEDIGETQTSIRDGLLPLDKLGEISNQAFQSLGLARNEPIAKAILDKRASEKGALERVKEALALIAIGAGALALALGGPASVVVVGAAAGLGSSFIELYQQVQWMSIQEAAKNTSLDPETRKLFEQGDPDLVALALSIAAVGLDLVAAGAAAKGLIGPLRAWRASRAAALAAEETEVARLRLLEAMDDAKLPPGARESIAPGSSASTIAATQAMSRSQLERFIEKTILKIRTARSVKPGMVTKALADIEAFLGKEAAGVVQDVLKGGGLRPLTKNALVAEYGAIEGAKKWDRVMNEGMRGFYDKGRKVVFVTDANQAAFSAELVHEAMHVVQAENLGMKLITFQAEFGAYKMESVFLNNLAAERGLAEIPERLHWLVGDPSAVNQRIVKFIETEYAASFAARKGLVLVNPYLLPGGLDDTGARQMLEEVVKGLASW